MPEASPSRLEKGLSWKKVKAKRCAQCGRPTTKAERDFCKHCGAQAWVPWDSQLELLGPESATGVPAGGTSPPMRAKSSRKLLRGLSGKVAFRDLPEPSAAHTQYVSSGESGSPMPDAHGSDGMAPGMIMLQRENSSGTSLVTRAGARARRVCRQATVRISLSRAPSWLAEVSTASTKSTKGEASGTGWSEPSSSSASWRRWVPWSRSDSGGPRSGSGRGSSKLLRGLSGKKKGAADVALSIGGPTDVAHTSGVRMLRDGKMRTSGAFPTEVHEMVRARSSGGA